MTADGAGGVLRTFLERLGLHYGMIDVARLGAISSDQSYGRGVKAVLEFISVFSTNAKPDERAILQKLALGLQTRFSRHA